LKVLIAGGAGYIGSTTASALHDRGHEPVILDNLVTGRESFTNGRPFYRGDIADGALLDQIFADHPDISAAIHCAGLIVVSESVDRPLRYYRENVAKSIDFVEHLVRNGCHRLLFSSSASIYAPRDDFSVDEESPALPTSPYARTKAMFEQILEDCATAGDLRVVSLRYFNPIGADPSMRTGLQLKHPSHALGQMIAAWEEGGVFAITGVDWQTRDGTGIRDYIHVWDLARAHVEALLRFDDMLPEAAGGGYEAINLGTGKGTTVRELLAAFERVTGCSLPTAETGPRLGDSVGAYTSTERSTKLLDWRPEYTLDDGIRDSLRWRALDQGAAWPPAG
jgi:UDP-glucose 4-epimerase